MDHKVSKDMISSGMIPSGEKTQADLGRTQYGSAPSPSSLMDAYKSIYEHHQKDKDGNTIPHEGEQLNEGKMPEGLKNYLMKKKGKKEDKKDMKEGLATAAGGTIGYQKGGVKGAIVGGTAGALLDKMGKKKNASGIKKEGYDPADKKAATKGLKTTVKNVSDTVRGAAIVGGGALVAKKMSDKKKMEGVKEDKEQVNEVLGLAAGAIGAKLAGGAAAKAAIAKGATAGAAKMAAMKAGTGAALKYGTAGSIAGSALGGVKKFATTPVTKKPSGTLSADVDLFDIVKGRLLDEGLTEEESLDVMLTLTLEEINEVIQLDEITAGLMMKAAKAAEVARGKAAVAGNKALAMKKLGQGEKFYKGAVAKRKAAGQMGAGYKEGM